MDVSDRACPVFMSIASMPCIIRSTASRSSESGMIPSRWRQRARQRKIGSSHRRSRLISHWYSSGLISDARVLGPSHSRKEEMSLVAVKYSNNAYRRVSS